MNGKAIDVIAHNLRKPTDRIPNPDPDALEGSTIPRPLYVFGAVSQLKLLIACEAIRYYEMVGRELTLGIMAWPVLKNFELQWKALKALTGEDKPKVPKLNPKKFPVICWLKSFVDMLYRSFGTHLVPLLYVVQMKQWFLNQLPRPQLGCRTRFVLTR